MKAGLFKLLTRFLLPGLLVMLWEVIAIRIGKPGVLPRVESVFAVLEHPSTRVLTGNSLLECIYVSLARVIVAFILAIAIAVPTGIFMGRYQVVKNLGDSLVELFRPVPPLAWVPLILAWTGITSLAEILPWRVENALLWNIQLSMLLIIMIGVFFPVLLNTIHGVQSVPPQIIEAAQTLGAREQTLLTRVILPQALPCILTGTRIGLGVGWMCLVAAEMLPGSTAGLGYLIWYAHELMRTDIVLAGIIIIGLIGTAFDQALRLIESTYFSWIE
ncbi:ABC transporter permease [Moorella naiadis]|uniref:ABC transporter permease n=1 Tax=Moorella naiadis (nom. illeg.) TaxID=3093670 RepID=UPI003D9C9F43